MALNSRDPSAFASLTLGLKVSTTMSSLQLNFLKMMSRGFHNNVNSVNAPKLYS